MTGRRDSKFPFDNSKAACFIPRNGDVIFVERKKAKMVVNTKAMNADKKTICVVLFVVRWIASRLWYMMIEWMLPSTTSYGYMRTRNFSIVFSSVREGRISSFITFSLT